MSADNEQDRIALFDLLSEVKHSIKHAPEMNTIFGSAYVALLENTVDRIANELFDDTKHVDATPSQNKFANIYCSQCGSDFGPGEHGYSSCISHAEVKPL
jgi:hypothetical protein